MADKGLLELVTKGVAGWNTWRAAHPMAEIDLHRATLAGINLGDADLSKADLRDTAMEGVNLFRAKLRLAALDRVDMSQGNLTYADLRDARCVGASFKGVTATEANFSGVKGAGANFAGANLTGVDFSDGDWAGANFTNATLHKANFTNANCHMATFTGANMTATRVDGADMRLSNWSEANVSQIKWSRGAMRGKYLGVRGMGSTYGNAVFRRDALDQDFVDAAGERSKKAWWRRALFLTWGVLTDYGRSLPRLVVLALAVVGLFGVLYQSFPLLEYADGRVSGFTPWFVSWITFVPLGHSMATPVSVWGEIAVTLETLLGYGHVALLVAVLADKVARRY